MSIWRQQIVTSEIGEYSNNSKFELISKAASANHSSYSYESHVNYFLGDREMQEIAYTTTIKVIECRLTIKEAKYQATKQITLYSSE